MAVLDELLATERQLWSNNATIYARTFLPDAILIFPLVGRISLDAALEAIRREHAEDRRWAKVEFEDAITVSTSPDTHLLAYRAKARWNDRPEPEEVNCLTVYLRRDDAWRVAAHQQTAR